MNITGTTTIFGVIGNPIRHSFSPIMHNAAFESLGLNCAYVPMEVPPDKLENAIKGLHALGFKGVNVTIPYKESVIPFMGSLSTEATTIGSVNTISIDDNGKLHGYDTDGDGFIQALKEDLQFSCEGKIISILGTGGASRAIALYCAKNNAQNIVIVGRNKDKAGQLADRVKQFHPETITQAIDLKDISFRGIIESSDLLVNATSNGMKPSDPILVPYDWLIPKLKVYDLIYNPLETKLIQAAKMQGCQTANGLGMLIHQGALAFGIWLGIQPPLEVYKKSIMDYLEGRFKMEGDK